MCKFLHLTYKSHVIIVIFLLFFSFPFCSFHIKNGAIINHSPNFYELSDNNLYKDVENTNQDNLVELYAKAASLYDSTGDRFLYEKNSNELLPMASTTKIMTCILALESCDLNEIISVSSYSASMPDVQLNIRKGEQYLLNDLLYSLMLESHNDVAAAIAEYIGCKICNHNVDNIPNNNKEQSKAYISLFAKLMTDKATELGCYHTSFVTPNGLDSEKHYTTSNDLCIIAAYALSNNVFTKIINTSSYTFTSLDSSRVYALSNKNNFLNIYDGAIGCKTGFTSKAGYCFVGAAEKNGVRLISVVLASGWPPNKTYKWSDTTKLMNYGYDNYDMKEIINPTIDLPKISVLEGVESDFINLEIHEKYSLMLNSNDIYEYVYDIPSQISAPIKKGDIVGNIYVKLNNYTKKIIPVYVSKSINKITYNDYLKDTFKKIFLLKICTE